MTIKEAKLPVTLYLVFDNDSEIYPCELVAVESIDTENDTCKLVCNDLMPQTCRLTAPYSMLDAVLSSMAKDWTSRMRAAMT
ncbi:MAG: hypothetical protein MJZ35_08650 [Bacteroidaceae bacterium]|nr:hypothetical protein [Bacteroidaceae bacterium]